MTIALPPLPYEKNSLEPHISSETLEYHYQKHHASYAAKLNALIRDTYLEKQTLKEIISTSSGDVLINAGQVFNHSFYWQSMSPNGGGLPHGVLASAIDSQWGSFDDFKASFNDKALNNLGSGWTWLVKTPNGKLDILNTANAETPVSQQDLVPILVIDLWEHAYYIDYRNRRSKYLEAFWALVNWNFASNNFIAAP